MTEPGTEREPMERVLRREGYGLIASFQALADALSKSRAQAEEVRDDDEEGA